MFLKFHITFEDSQGRTVTEFKQVALHYLKQPTGFLLDALASFPFEILALPIPNPKLRIGILLYLRLTHVLRLDRVQHFFASEGRKLNQKWVNEQEICIPSAILAIPARLCMCDMYAHSYIYICP